MRTIIPIILPVLLFFVTIYNYSVPLGDDGNDTIVMYYDEPLEKLLQDNNKDDEDDDEDDG